MISKTKNGMAKATQHTCTLLYAVCCPLAFYSNVNKTKVSVLNTSSTTKIRFYSLEKVQVFSTKHFYCSLKKKK